MRISKGNSLDFLAAVCLFRPNFQNSERISLNNEDWLIAVIKFVFAGSSLTVPSKNKQFAIGEKYVIFGVRTSFKPMNERCIV